MIDDPRTFTQAALQERIAALQTSAFTIYETAAGRAESEPAHRDTYYAQAERDVAPLLVESRRFHDELLRRLRRRARRWRQAALLIGVVGCAALAWLWLRGAVQ